MQLAGAWKRVGQKEGVSLVAGELGEEPLVEVWLHQFLLQAVVH